MDQFSQGEEPAPNLETAAETVVDRDESPSKALALGIVLNRMNRVEFNGQDGQDGNLPTCQVRKSRVLRPKKQ